MALYESGALAQRQAQVALSLFSQGSPAGWTCADGSMQLHVDGSQANKLPTGSHALAAAFDTCLILGDDSATTLNGAISGDYSLAGDYDYDAQLSVLAMSGSNLVLASHLQGVSGRGSLTLTRESTGDVNSTAFAYRTTVAPVGGFQLVKDRTGNAMTFGSGSYSSSYDTATRSGSDDFNGLEVEVNGAHYALDGSIQWTFDGDRGIRYTSGVVRITSGGALHACLAGQASGVLLVEVVIPLERL